LRFGGRATLGHDPFVLSEYVDLNSFLRMLSGGHPAVALGGLVLVAACVLPCLARLWAGARDNSGVALAWASALTWTSVVNLYVGVYDTVVIPLAVVLMVDAVRRQSRASVPTGLLILLASLYVTPWVPPVPVGENRRLQLYTVALVALGVYQIWLGLRRRTHHGAVLTEDALGESNMQRIPREGHASASILCPP
jgi:hypothetical protein